MLKSGFHEHALADARSVCCDVKSPADPFTQANRDFATRRGLALTRWNADVRGMHILIRQLLHFLTFSPRPHDRYRRFAIRLMRVPKRTGITERTRRRWVQ